MVGVIMVGVRMIGVRMVGALTDQREHRVGVPRNTLHHLNTMQSTARRGKTRQGKAKQGKAR